MAGRPPLRLGQHGKVSRIELAKGTWVARCRYRDTDGVTRIVERKSPIPGQDQRGKQAEDELLDSLKNRQPPTSAGKITGATKVADLITAHIERLEKANRSPATLTTYRSAARKLEKYTAQLRVDESTPGRLDAAIKSMKEDHGANMARHTRTLLRGALRIAVLEGALSATPVDEVDRIESDRPAKGAPALDADELRDLMAKIQASETCHDADLVDPILLFIATGLRRSELLATTWADFNEKARVLTMAAKVIRVPGQGLKRLEVGKSASALRTVPLPAFAVDILVARRSKPFWGEQQVIFPSSAGGLRDPDNFNKQWRRVRQELGVPDVTSHSFRKSVATLIDEAGMSARIGADQLGHSKVSMTQDKYMRRGKVHSEVAAMLDRTLTEEASLH